MSNQTKITINNWPTITLVLILCALFGVCNNLNDITHSIDNNTKAIERLHLEER